MYLGTVFGKCTKGATTLHANTLAAKWVPVRRVAGWQPVSLTLERMQECNVVSDMSSFLPTLSLRWMTFGFPQEGRIQLLCSSIQLICIVGILYSDNKNVEYQIRHESAIIFLYFSF
jgi:hypothetical protein